MAHVKTLKANIKALKANTKNITAQRQAHSLNSSPIPATNASYCARKSLFHRGVLVHHKIAQTLQGSIYRGKLLNKKTNTFSDIVIKRADVYLHQHGMAKTKQGQLVYVKENIVKEAQMMNYLCKFDNAPKGILKVHDFVSYGKNYFLVMEYGGTGLFDHVKTFHTMIKQKEIKLSVWTEHVNILFKQMVKIVSFLHNKASVCHMDISLENCLIKGCQYKDGRFVNHGQVYFCDWGLSELFTKASYSCAKYVGKVGYQAPEVYAGKDKFDARLGDIWSLGVCLFIMALGVAPYSKPNKTDKTFCNLINGYMHRMIKDHGKAKYVNKSMINLLNSIFCSPSKRVDINHIIRHKYVKTF